MGDLDELTIPAPRTGAALQRLGVTAQLYIADGHRPDPRRAALAVVRDIVELAPGRFPLWMGSEHNRPRQVREGTGEEMARSAEHVIDRRDQTLSIALLQRENPPRWQAETMMLAEEPRRSRLSRVTFSAPPSFALKDTERYVDLVARWAHATRPQYGTAGLALVDEAGMAHHRSGAALPWLERYPGLDCETFNLQPKPGRYVSVNWLTVVGDPVIDELGGGGAIRSRLALAAEERGIETPRILRYEGGIVIRASDLPLLGDRGRGDIPAPYRAVNAALREARFEDYPEGPNMHLIDAPRGTNLRQATLDWIRRFDD